MPKITRFGGHSIAGITDTATGSTERDSGFTEDADKVRAHAAERSDDDPPTTFLGDDGGPTGLVAGGDDAPAKDEAPFDPADLSVADVQGLLAECTDAERAAVVEAERNGKNRKGIVGE